MYKLDEMITEIRTAEVIEISEELSESQKKTIEAKVFEKMNILDGGCEMKEYKIKRFPRRKSLAVMVAVLVLTLGFTVFAAKQNEWDITLINFMGLNEAHVLQLEGGEVVIDKTITSTWEDYAQNLKGEEVQISITKITSIGDKNSAYLRINTDYELPADFDEKTDYILPENHRIDIVHKNKLGREEIRTFASTYMSIYEEGKLGFLVSIEGCENLNTCNVAMCIEDLYWYHDLGQYEETEDSEPKELLAAGKWETKWKYSYKSNVKKVRTLKRFETNEGNIFLTEIEISPISIRMEAVRSPKDCHMPWTTEMLEEIQYEDGKVIPVNNGMTGGLRDGIYIEQFVNVYSFGEVLRPEEIKSLKVCGNDVDI